MTEFDITYRGTVYPWQCDHMGHMNVMWYSGKFDEASWQLLAKLGFTRAHFREHGTGMAAVEQNITYKRELHAGDVVTVRSRVLEIKEKSIQIVHEMTNDETGDLVAVSVIVGVYMDTTLRKARAIPMVCMSERWVSRPTALRRLANDDTIDGRGDEGRESWLGKENL